MKGDYTRDTFKITNHYSGVRMQQGRVQTDADWNEQIDLTQDRIETEASHVIGRCGAPVHDAGFALKPNGGSLDIGKGSYYVDGILCRNEAPVSITQQPDLPANAPIVRIDSAWLTLDKAQEGVYLAWLDVWTHHLTALEDPAIREVALGGPDTATRTKTVWQIRLLKAADGIGCLTDVPAWNDLVRPSTGRLNARAKPDQTSTNPCAVAPGAGYRRLENQLYRVEVHQGGILGKATFKWSRDNGSIVTAWQKKTGDDLTVASLGRDPVLGFAAGQWVELTDDDRELTGQPGTLVRLKDARGQTLTIDPATATGTVNLADFKNRAKVRRWDGAKETPTQNAWLPLEDGVEVRFEAGTYATGDWWLIPARTATAGVEWPQDASKNPLPQLARGIRHHVCRLAMIELKGGKWAVLSDCRNLFPPLTELTRCCCTVEVGDGVSSHGDFDEIATALAAASGRVAADTPIRICVLPGTHHVKETVVINRPQVTITGCGRESRVAAPPNGPSFDIRASSVHVEHLYFASNGAGTASFIHLSAAAFEAWIKDNGFSSQNGPSILSEGAGKLRIVGNQFAGSKGILVRGDDVLIARNEIYGPSSIGQVREHGLIDLRAGTSRARVIENRLDSGPGHGITLSPASRNDEPRSLSDIVIAGNEIHGMLGSGVATSLFSDTSTGSGISGFPSQPTGTTPIYIYGLRIEHNVIEGCVRQPTWARDDGAPQGGIVVGGVKQLLIADNRIESNGTSQQTTTVAGIYVGRGEGLIVRDNVVRGNGPQATGKPVQQVEGGIVALSLAVSQEALEFGFDLNTVAADVQRIVSWTDFLRPDGWPAVMVHGNLVAAPRGRALMLDGLGPMHVTDNLLIAREISSATGSQEGIGGAAWINSWDFVSLRGSVAASSSALTNSLSLGTSQNLPPIVGSVIFSDNQVSLDGASRGPEGIKRSVVVIEASDDLAFHDNQVRCLSGTESLLYNTALFGTTVRASGNGVFEAQIELAYSLVVYGLMLSSGCENQTTHCIDVQGAQFKNSDNLMLNCPQTSVRIDLSPTLARIEARRREILAGFQESMRNQAESLRQEHEALVRTSAPAAPQLQALERRILGAEQLAGSVGFGLRMSNRAKEIQPGDWTLMGRVLDAKGQPIAGARLELQEGGREPTEIKADEQGEIFVHFAEKAFQDIFQQAPQLKVVVKAADGKVLQTLEQTLTPIANRVERFELRIGETPAPSPHPGKTTDPSLQSPAEQTATKAEPAASEKEPRKPEPSASKAVSAPEGAAQPRKKTKKAKPRSGPRKKT